jgi:hypothetical protein
MTFAEKYNSVPAGAVSGFLMPFIVGITIYLFSGFPMPLNAYISRIAESDIITHSVTLCVFPNILIFLLFNRFDMLGASRGVLAITIFWAILVFAIKLF